MRFLLLIFVLMIAVSWSAFGKAYFYTRSELIQKAVAIAIIEIAEPTDNAPTEVDPFAPESAKSCYRQQAKVRVEKVLKGELPQQFTLYGEGSFICAQCMLSKGQFLAFLAKDEDVWIGANWQLSLRPVQDTEVEWYVSEGQRFPMTFQKLDDVIEQIQGLLKESATQGSTFDSGKTAN